MAEEKEVQEQEQEIDIEDKEKDFELEIEDDTPEQDRTANLYPRKWSKILRKTSLKSIPKR
jgi:hypothetical protein